ncbi:MAG: 50S ribosomal protein L23 [Candidatus Micrarchaeia archaeon]
MKVLMYPVSTEKAINMINKDNIITFVVDSRAKKTEIVKDFESTFGVKVKDISTMVSPQNTKKAFIRLAPEYKATDIAIKLKLV